MKNHAKWNLTQLFTQRLRTGLWIFGTAGATLFTS